MRLIEILAAYLPLLREARAVTSRAVDRAHAGQEIDDDTWDRLQDAQLKSTELHAEVCRILTRAQARTRQWLWR